MADKARRLRLAAGWLGEALREVAVLFAVFLPIDVRFDRSSYTPLNVIVFYLFVLLIFGLGVTIGFVGELESNE